MQSNIPSHANSANSRREYFSQMANYFKMAGGGGGGGREGVRRPLSIVELLNFDRLEGRRTETLIIIKTTRSRKRRRRRRSGKSRRERERERESDRAQLVPLAVFFKLLRIFHCLSAEGNTTPVGMRKNVFSQIFRGKSKQRTVESGWNRPC